MNAKLAAIVMLSDILIAGILSAYSDSVVENGAMRSQPKEATTVKRTDQVEFENQLQYAVNQFIEMVLTQTGSISQEKQVVLRDELISLWAENYTIRGKLLLELKRINTVTPFDRSKSIESRYTRQYEAYKARLKAYEQLRSLYMNACASAENILKPQQLNNFKIAVRMELPLGVPPREPQYPLRNGGRASDYGVIMQPPRINASRTKN